MAGAKLATDAILLTRRESGEHGLLLTLLSPTHGLLSAFKRTSVRSRQPLPDLFDEVSLTLEKAKAGELWFVSEYRVQRRRPKVGAHYASLLYACRYALLLSHHLFEPDEAVVWTQQLTQALDAWESALHPAATYFKAIYLYARLQGIPVNEEWLHPKSESKVAFIRSILHQPLAEQTASQAAIERVIGEFEDYLHHHHDVRFGN